MTRAGRDKALATASDKLSEVVARLADLDARNEKAAQARLDRHTLRQIADDQRALAEQTAKRDGPADELAKKQRDLLARLNEVIARSGLLKGAQEAAAGEQLHDLLSRVRKLAEDQAALDRAIRDTEQTMRLRRTEELARRQRELADEAARLAERTEAAARLVGTAPLGRQPFEQAVERLTRGDTERALTEQEKAARELDRLADGLGRAAAARGDVREAARQIARWQDDLRRRYADVVAGPSFPTNCVNGSPPSSRRCGRRSNCSDGPAPTPSWRKPSKPPATNLGRPPRRWPASRPTPPPRSSAAADALSRARGADADRGGTDPAGPGPGGRTSQEPGGDRPRRRRGRAVSRPRRARPEARRHRRPSGRTRQESPPTRRSRSRGPPGRHRVCRRPRRRRPAVRACSPTSQSRSRRSAGNSTAYVKPWTVSPRRTNRRTNWRECSGTLPTPRPEFPAQPTADQLRPAPAAPARGRAPARRADHSRGGRLARRGEGERPRSPTRRPARPTAPTNSGRRRGRRPTHSPGWPTASRARSPTRSASSDWPGSERRKPRRRGSSSGSRRTPRPPCRQSNGNSTNWT